MERLLHQSTLILAVHGKIETTQSAVCTFRSGLMELQVVRHFFAMNSQYESSLHGLSYDWPPLSLAETQSVLLLLGSTFSCFNQEMNGP